MTRPLDLSEQYDALENLRGDWPLETETWNREAMVLLIGAVLGLRRDIWNLSHKEPMKEEVS